MTKTSTLAWALASTLCAPALAWADSGLVGTWRLEGREGATVTFRSADASGARVTRAGEQVLSSNDIRMLHLTRICAVTYTASATAGVRHVLTGAAADVRTLVGYYMRTGDEVREVLVEERKGQSRQVGDARGERVAEPAVLAELRALTADLDFVSETDVGWTVTSVPGAGTAPLHRFKALMGLPADRPSETRSFDSLARLAETDPTQSAGFNVRARRYGRLFQALTTRLTDLRVYRVGDAHAEQKPWGIEPSIHVFVVGRTPQGDLVVLETFSVET